MSEVALEPSTPSSRAAVGIFDIFIQFLIIGATSFGGGAVAYLRSSLVGKNKWLDDQSFLELFSISQSLPGLNTTNMAILAGDRLRGWLGALAAVFGIIVPGATESSNASESTGFSMKSAAPARIAWTAMAMSP
jgi:chromate transporter